MNFAYKYRYHLASFLLLVCLLALAVFVKFPYRISAVCRLVPAEQWSLQELPSGRVVSRHLQYFPYQLKELNVLQFDRQDFVRLQMNSQLTPGKLNR